MSLFEALRLALAQMRVQKLKSGFTLLGVTIGVMFLIAVVAVVEGMSRYMEHDLIGAFMSVNTFELRRQPNMTIGNVDEATEASYTRRPWLMVHDTTMVIAALPPGFRHAVTNSGMLTVSSRYARPRSVQISATTHEYFTIRTLRMASGRPFSEQEDALHAPVVVIGHDVQEHCFPGIDPLGRDLRIGDLPYRVIGIAAAQGSTFGFSRDNFVVVPYGTPASQLLAPVPGAVESMVIQAPTPTAQVVGEEAVREVLRARDELHPEQPDDFTLETPEAALAFFDKLKRYLVLAGIVLPTVGLVVGAIVIMNIMLVAVAERTREIGIRKSLGATRRDILLQFLIEAATLSTVGALFGIALGACLSWGVTALTPLPTHVAAWSVVTSVLLGVGVGVTAGVYPASRAARLDPIVALHTE